MSGKTVLHPMQMKLFVDPEEHISSVVGATDQRTMTETRQDLWHRKEMEARDPDPTAHGGGLYQSIKKEGYNPERPIEVVAAEDQSGWVQFEGHHRAAAARAVQRDTGKQQWVPIRYHSFTFPSEAQLQKGGQRPVRSGVGSSSHWNWTQ